MLHEVAFFEWTPVEQLSNLIDVVSQGMTKDKNWADVPGEGRVPHLPLERFSQEVMK